MTTAHSGGFRWLPSYYEAVRDLPERERLLIYDAILDYGFGNPVGELPPLLAGYFRLIVPTLDRSVKFEADQRAKGKKGGRPKRTEENPEESRSEIFENPEESRNEVFENPDESRNEVFENPEESRSEIFENPDESRSEIFENLDIDVAVDADLDRVFDNDSVVGGVKEGERASRTGTREARFTPPSADEVRDYCLSRKRYIDCERFVDYYTAKGWRIGGEPMTDWRAAVRSWESREGDFDIRAPDGYAW